MHHSMASLCTREVAGEEIRVEANGGNKVGTIRVEASGGNKVGTIRVGIIKEVTLHNSKAVTTKEDILSSKVVTTKEGTIKVEAMVSQTTT